MTKTTASAKTTASNDTRHGLTMGSLLFHWDDDTRRDFYFRVADEAPVDTVYLGEVVCSKRAALSMPQDQEIIERLLKAGKTVVYSTLAQVTTQRDRDAITQIATRDHAPMKDLEVEVNDGSAWWHLDKAAHRVGPFINVYSEDALAFAVRNGATHVTISPEIPEASLAVLGDAAKTLGVSLEMQVFGRIPLALSARCYHARAHDRVKNGCRFACGADADGMDLKTLDGENFLTINGIQTLSHTCLNLVRELPKLQEMGLRDFRLSPQSFDMVAVATVFRNVLDKKVSTEEALSSLDEIVDEMMPFSNGFYYKTEGWRWVA